MFVNPWKEFPVHRIYVFTEHGLTPKLVDNFFNKALEYGCNCVLDPFVGSGTVLVEAQYHGLESIGIDVNPWCLLVSRAKTQSPGDMSVILKGFKHDFLKDLKPLIPSKRLFRYYHNEILLVLGKIRAFIENVPVTARPLLLTVFVKLAERFSLLRKSPAPRYRNSTRKVNTDLIELFRQEVLRAIKDLSQRRFSPPTYLIMADSTSWLPRKVEAVLTSPPFANNVDYIRHTQLALLWVGIAKDSHDLGRLRSIQVPACEAAARSWKPCLKEVWLTPYLESIGGSRSKGYRKFLMQYLYAMRNHLKLLAERLEWEAWYTIGDSILGGAYIPTHEFLAKFAKETGLKVSIEALLERVRPGRRLYLLKILSRR